MVADEIAARLREMLMGEETVSLSEESIDEIVAACMAATLDGNVQRDLANLTAALKKDPDVTGVGATIEGQSKPSTLRSREQFGIELVEELPHPEPEEQLTTRSKTKAETVILTEPVLTTAAKRKWRVVREDGKEVAASMKDEKFWTSLVAGETGLPMSGGVHLDVQLQIKSEQDPATKLWRDLEYVIISVDGWSDGEGQPSLTLLDKD